MPAPVDVYNMALMRIGVFNDKVEDVTEQSKGALVCTVFYNMMRQYVLRDFPFNFAETRATLAALGNPPQNWNFNYLLPPDCVRALYITTPGIRRPPLSLQPTWQIVQVSGTRQVVTDMNPVELVYTADIQDLNQWDPIAISALAYRLGAEIAMPMKASAGIAQSCMQAYIREANRAAAASMSETILDPEADNEILQAHGTSMQGIYPYYYPTGIMPDGFPIYPGGQVE